METGTLAGQIYLLTLLIFNGSAFIFICFCYAKMYATIRAARSGGNRAPATQSTRNDLQIAKRMSLLVFTDFLCWAPIAFFGLTALMGKPLLSVSHAKVLLVFFYPINATANPYMYAIVTKQYRSDLYALLRRCGGGGWLGRCRNRRADDKRSTPNATATNSLRRTNVITRQGGGCRGGMSTTSNMTIFVEVNGAKIVTASTVTGSAEEQRLRAVGSCSESSSGGSRTSRGSPHPLRSSSCASRPLCKALPVGDPEPGVDSGADSDDEISPT
ncbi:unnamed protein product [Darwinula stevensoni]|uniref:G-protein coupled receptors family 1 profile domain-containing protein n=1 Tax=Darwinula stevensoni TaxID=69355 RepID=A0A7R9FTJ0_9CRUS|nr:unnamed protein product [Darwinula stevensoni]CAG0905466.1 unnamed protein product [Darwinula stevensoni]